MVFPEGWDSNGRVGIMQYQKFLFSLGIPVQPVALKVSIPWLPMIEASKLGTSIFAEILWMCFVPFFYFELEFLPIQKQQEKETEIEFAKRVQVMTANALNVTPTEYSFKDALELRKKLV